MKVTIELDNVSLEFIMALLEKSYENSRGKLLYDLKKDRNEDYKSQSEISRLKLFMEVFNGLSGQDKNDVDRETFFNELIQTGRFSLDQCDEMLKKALQNGQIYERRTGWYAKA
jgi:hypothetical protein